MSTAPKAKKQQGKANSVKNSASKTSGTPKNAKGKSPQPNKTPVNSYSNGQDAFDFLVIGDTPEALEEKWLTSITDLIEQKRSVQEADKFSDYLKQLYDALSKELCKKCSVPFKPIFDETNNAKEVQFDTSERENEEIKDTDKRLAESSAKINELKHKNQELESELQRLKHDNKVLNDELPKYKNDIHAKSEEIKKLKDDLNKSQKQIKELVEENAQKVNTNAKTDVTEQLNKKIEEKERSISNLTEDNAKKDTEISNQNIKVDALQKEKSKLEEDMKEKVKTLEKEVERLRTFEKENENLKKEIESLKSEINGLKSRNADQNKSKETEENEQIKRLTKENESERLRVKSLQDQLSQKEKKIKESEDTIKVLTEQNDSNQSLINEINGKVRMEVDEHNKKSNSLLQTLKSKESDMIDLKRDLEKYKKQIDDHNSTIKRHEEEISKLKNELEEEKSKLKKEKKNSEKGPGQRLKDLQEENSNLRDRLSQVAGSKMTDSNPAIADLGDPNRPTQLGEKFSEMYDNDWTDAMEELGNAGDERTNINLLHVLRTIIEKAYEFGKTRAATYNSDQEKALLNLSNSIQMNTTLSKLIKELRKNIGILVVDGLYQAFTSGHTEFKAGGDNVKNFMKKAVALCWLMAIQDPPVILTTKTPSGKFDTDRFRHYTKSGSTVDYVVWPVVLLHEGGPIICKGVAQGK